MPKHILLILYHSDGIYAVITIKQFFIVLRFVRYIGDCSPGTWQMLMHEIVIPRCYMLLSMCVYGFEHGGILLPVLFCNLK